MAEVASGHCLLFGNTPISSRICGRGSTRQPRMAVVEVAESTQTPRPSGSLLPIDSRELNAGLGRHCHHEGNGRALAADRTIIAEL